MAYKSIRDLDAIDIKIIEKLCKDSSASLNDIAQELGISASTVHKRINTLKENNIIERFTILFDPMILNLKTVAFVGIELERDALMGKKKEDVIKRLTSIPYVLEVHETLAPFDLILKLRTKNVEKLRGVITNIASIEGIMATNTILTTNRIMERFIEIPQG
ncbi:Transcriptional regulator, AsnC family [Methanocella conradii HZ254]|uniref:Transcriptional regulator, AsnC family n=1 Tax=Methanocella conradii (strain DSM 24694 / JCM 17849 / CGMCC 1.5162 / HZ254) TaxID=1041930 RepID=H8I5I2_METCZ|nr:Lrp/AsnC family transcriptional regulator [Methanocella conradii]AFC99301.1 Transcriptional regulator, AsnC family [Methanocella conradii HZ254]MDI6896921.1 Lrp/AsnC family transcriptional regulator [Methanocella conradii]